MIIVNFKNYVSGKKSLDLARKIEKSLPEAIIAVSSSDIGYLYGKVNLKIYAQHVSYHSIGRSTGFVNSDSVKSVGCIGTLLNHSEHRLLYSDLKKSVKKFKNIRLKTILCAHSLKQVQKFMKLKPYAIAFEDPKLIATNKSVIGRRPRVIKRFVKILSGSGVKSICGAGIHSAKDIKHAKELGCNGVLIASAIAYAKARDVDRLLKEISRV